MKKSILAIAMMAALVAGADTDSYLYWMVNVDTSAYNYDYTVKVKGNYSAEYQGKSDSYLSLYEPNGNPGAGIDNDYFTRTTVDKYAAYEGVGLYAALLSDPTYSSFVVEIWNAGATELITSSEAFGYDAAFIARSGIGAPASGMMMASMTLPIPEPTSGMLLLLGVAGLALRRRKMRVA